MSLNDSLGTQSLPVKPQAHPVKPQGARQGPKSPKTKKIKTHFQENVCAVTADLGELTLEPPLLLKDGLKPTSDSDDSGSSESEDVDIDPGKLEISLGKKYREKRNPGSPSSSRASSVLSGPEDPSSRLGKYPFDIGPQSDSLEKILDPDSDSEYEFK